MPRNPLDTLIKIRRIAYDDAQRELVQALDAEHKAAQLVRETDNVIALEMETAADPLSSDAVVEAFGAWFAGARRQLDLARQALGDRQAETVRVRAILIATRTALESVETLRDQRREKVRRGREDRLQRDLDDRPAAEREPEETD